MSIRPWNLVFLVGFAIYVCLRGVYSGRTRVNRKASTRTHPGDRALLGLVFVGNVFLPILYLFTPWLDFADTQVPVWTRWCGVVAMSVALWLFWRSHVDLGLNWSMNLETRQGHELITTGVYRKVRHPMYAAIWLFGIAQALLLENWLAGWSALVTFAPLYFIRTPREEQFLSECFGQAYHEYMRKTGRLVPHPFRKES